MNVFGQEHIGSLAPAVPMLSLPNLTSSNAVFKQVIEGVFDPSTTSYFPCRADDCLFMSKTEQLLAIHVFHKHENNPPPPQPSFTYTAVQNVGTTTYVQCKHCKFVGQTKADLSAHLQESHPERIESRSARPKVDTTKFYFPCRHCLYLATTQADLSSHLKHSHPPSEFATASATAGSTTTKVYVHCKHCNFVGKTQGQLVKHLKESHPDNADAMAVAQHFMANTVAAMPIAQVFKVSPVTMIGSSRQQSPKVVTITRLAAPNGKGFNAMIQVKQSNAFAVEEGSTDKPDVILVSSSKNRGALKEKKRYQCTSCDYSSSAIQHLKRHDKAVHQKVRGVHCPHCSHTTSSNGDLRRHIKFIHEKLKEFKCEHCDYSSCEKSKVAKHVKIVHERIRDFKCQECDYSAAYQSHMDRHVKAVHQKIRDHGCDHCDYRSSDQDYVLRHIKRVHDKIREFKCQLCPFAGSFNYDLTNHMKAAHEKGGRFKPGEEHRYELRAEPLVVSHASSSKSCVIGLNGVRPNASSDLRVKIARPSIRLFRPEVKEAAREKGGKFESKDDDYPLITVKKEQSVVIKTEVGEQGIDLLLPASQVLDSDGLVKLECGDDVKLEFVDKVKLEPIDDDDSYFSSEICFKEEMSPEGS